MEDLGRKSGNAKSAFLIDLRSNAGIGAQSSGELDYATTCISLSGLAD